MSEPSPGSRGRLSLTLEAGHSAVLVLPGGRRVVVTCVEAGGSLGRRARMQFDAPVDVVISRDRSGS